MAKRNAEFEKAARARSARSIWAGLRLGFRLVMLAVILVGGLLAFQRLEHFLILDPRFAVQPAPDYGMDSPSLQVDGIVHTSKAQVEQVFQPDMGRSLYLFPAARRRAALLQIDWVKDASISRIWPNQILVRIRERQPVAFVDLTAKASGGFLLIDEDGVMLRPRTPGTFHLPVVHGVSGQDDPYTRKERIHRMQRLMRDLGPLGERVSEIDVSNADNLKVTHPLDGRAVVLLLGDRNFAQRMQNFLTHFPEIRQHTPNAVILDLRLEDRITATENSGTREGG